MIWRMQTFLLSVVWLWALLIPPTPASSSDPVKEGGWLIEKDEHTGAQIRTMEMTLHPRAEPRPALRYRLLPDEFEVLEGNAATYYLKALGFLEQHHSRQKLQDIYRVAAEKSQKEGNSTLETPPHSWRIMQPQDLPLNEVKQFLALTSFQPPLLREAARRRAFDLERNIREVDDPLAYLLPEIQGMRELARMQTLRCRVAIAEGRVEDAITIQGQQYAMARHLAKDDFLVSALVGIACAGIAWDDTLYLLQHPDTPNLYWSLASLPHPLINIRRALDVERQFLYLQFKVLREVDETPRSVQFWRDLIDRSLPRLGILRQDFGLPSVTRQPDAARALAVGYIAAAYPGARRYLIDDLGLPAKQVEAYPIAQVVLLALVRFHDEATDDYFKWTHLPRWQAESQNRASHIDHVVQVKANRVGWSAAPTQMLLPALLALSTAVARSEQQLALIQTVEAIRMYGAAHDGKLPASLDRLTVPAPLDPFTGKPIDYQNHGDYVEINGHEMPGMRYRLVVRFADKVR